MRSCIENLFHLSQRKQDIEDLVHQFNSNNLLDEEDLQPLLFPELTSNVFDGSRVNFASKHKLCGTCSSNYTQDECLKYKQDIEFWSTLQHNLIFFVDSLLTQSPSSPLPPLLIEEPVTQYEIRELKIQYFEYYDDYKIIRVNRIKVRIKVREDMIKHLLTKEDYIFQMLVVIASLTFLFI